MEKFALVLLTVLFCVSTGVAQTAKDLKGPKAKNHKVWKDNAEPSAIVFHPNKEKLTGPKAKNQKPWERKRANQEYVAVTSSNRAKMTGPRAKNWKPWMKSEQQNAGYLVKSSERKPDTDSTRDRKEE